MSDFLRTRASALRRFAARPGAPYLALALVLLALHAQFTLGTGDDPMYASILDNYTLWGFTVQHYYTWSARSLVEAALCVVEALPTVLWRVADPLLIALCAYLAARILGCEKNADAGWALAGLALCYDWTAMRTAGWVCTTLVFVWPLAAALAAAQPLVQARRGLRVPRWAYVTAALAAVYAANMEQLMVAMALCLLALLAHDAAARRKPAGFTWVLLAACAANAVYAVTCPGTAARAAGEATSWFIDFARRTFLENAQLGIASAMAGAVYERDVLFFLLCLGLAVAVWAHGQSWLLRAATAAGALAVLVLGVFGRQAVALVPKLAFFENAVTKYGVVHTATAWEPKRWLSFLLLLFVLAVCVVGLYAAIGHSRRAYFSIAALCAGFAARAMLGFSPTVWQSGARTGFFFGCACVYCAVNVWLSLAGCRRARLVWGASIALGAAWGVFHLIGA